MADAADDYADIREAEGLDALSEQFEEAAEHARRLAVRLEPAAALRLYGLYKQATEGACAVPQPRFFQARARAKWDAWRRLGAMGRDEAQRTYVQLVAELDPEFARGGKRAAWVSVSCPARPDAELADADKTAFDFAKDGALEQLAARVQQTGAEAAVRERDEHGLGLVHWAADRGHAHVLRYLLGLRADVAMRDADGQTPLHYAASCEHRDCVDVLLAAGADPRLPDADGATPRDLTSDAAILAALDKAL